MGSGTLTQKAIGALGDKNAEIERVLALIGGGEAKQIRDKVDYDNLEPGVEYIDPDGKRRTKPRKN